MSLQRPAYEEIIDVEAFIEAYGCDTPHEALRAAERAPSSSDYNSFKRCPNCGSVKVLLKPGHIDMVKKIDSTYKCGRGNCKNHFDVPAPSINEIAEREFGEPTELLSEASNRADALADALRRQEER